MPASLPLLFQCLVDVVTNLLTLFFMDAECFLYRPGSTVRCRTEINTISTYTWGHRRPRSCYLFADDLGSCVAVSRQSANRSETAATATCCRSYGTFSATHRLFFAAVPAFRAGMTPHPLSLLARALPPSPPRSSSGRLF